MTTNVKDIKVPDPSYNVEDGNEIIQVYKGFGCQMIASAFEILQSWAQPYSNYNKNQQLQLLEYDYENIDLYNLYIFFIPCEGFPSGLETLIDRFELKIISKDIEDVSKPLLKRAFIEANKYRALVNLKKIPTPK